MNAIDSGPYRAIWTENNSHLNVNSTPLKSFLNKIKNLIFYLPISFLSLCSNPRKESRFQDYNCSFFLKKTIITPDGARIQARVEWVKKINPNAPTVILFNPLGTSSDIYSELIYNYLLKKQCNVVTFNHRGLGSTWRSDDLVLDGESVYQYVTSELKFKNIRYFGHSLGSAVAAQVKALHPENPGKYVGDRPFLSIFSLISEFFCIARLGVAIKKITSFIAKLCLAYPVYLLGWEFDMAKAFSKMRAKDVLVLHHPEDVIIPAAASAAKLKFGRIEPLDIGTRNRFASHFAPIVRHTIKGKDAAETAVDFLTAKN